MKKYGEAHVIAAEKAGVPADVFVPAPVLVKSVKPQSFKKENAKVLHTVSPGCIAVKLGGVEVNCVTPLNAPHPEDGDTIEVEAQYEAVPGGQAPMLVRHWPKPAPAKQPDKK